MAKAASENASATGLTNCISYLLAVEMVAARECDPYTKRRACLKGLLSARTRCLNRKPIAVAPEDADFSDDFCRFLRTAIPAVDAAELVLLAHGDPARAWTAPEAAARYVTGLQASGLLEVDSEQRVRYRPASEALAAHVATLERVYRERPVTLIRVIYALRDNKIRSFAEAFRLRRK